MAGRASDEDTPHGLPASLKVDSEWQEISSSEYFFGVVHVEREYRNLVIDALLCHKFLIKFGHPAVTFPRLPLRLRVFLSGVVLLRILLCGQLSQMPLPRALVFAAETGLPNFVSWLARHRVALQEPAHIAWQALADEDNHTVLTAESVKFDVPAYHSFLRTRQFGQQLCYQPVISSTQTILQQAVATNPSASGISASDTAEELNVDGVTILADTQLEGKGRGSNKWVSPEGCLSFSFLANFTHGASLPFVQYLVSLAVVRAIKTRAGLEDLPLHIKWPNDIYVNRNTKIGGILCNAQHDPHTKTFTVIVGVGLNVNNSEPTTCLNDVIRAHTGGTEAGVAGDGPGDASPSSAALQAVDSGIAREELLARFFNQFESLRSTFLRDGGFGTFVHEYTDNWLHSNQEVMVEQAVVGTTIGASGASEPILRRARIVGISETGNLTVQFVETNGEATGPVEEVIPDTTSLDMLQGLVTRKRTPAHSQ